MLEKLKQKLKEYLTDRESRPVFSQIREAETGQSRENLDQENQENEQNQVLEKYCCSKSESCPYCLSKKIVKRGKRKKKMEIVQLYLCKDCSKTFTSQAVKGRHYPLKLIFDCLSIYNMGYGLEETSRFIKEKYGIAAKPSTINNWIADFSPLCKYSRMRKFGKKLFSPDKIAPGISLYHRQIYKFRIHRAKLALLLQEDMRHIKLAPLAELLEAIFAECPHHLFKDGQRISEVKVNFNLNKVIIREKHNFANRLAKLILQGVKDNKFRHEELQKFFIYNDSVTVATEVPVYLLPEDIEHMESQLDFEIPLKIEKVLTGHIDLIQMRNGLVHILDYKSNAAKEKPIEQLTLYALAMSRLTGLRLHEFKCAWFDEKNYYEFYPLHIVYKLRERQPRVPKNQQQLAINH